MSEGRPLTRAEWSVLSSGLVDALKASGAEPRIVSRAHPAARVVGLWRGATPVLTRGNVILWPNATENLGADRRTAAVLQHELQHVLDYRTGRMSAARYLIDPREWVYDHDLAKGTPFGALGAEQRATLAERLWMAENGYGDVANIDTLRGVIPWAARA